jgi:hypothetical protein
MAGNPLVQQGSLNRIIASVVWQSFPALNVTAPFLNREGIRLALDGDATRFLPTMTGAVTSPEPYQMVTLTINLVKSQGLASQYKSQMETQTVLGDCVVRPDTKGLPPYDLVNCALEGVRELSFSGEDAGFSVTVRGYYSINSSLFI